ncbi:MAG: FAD binding domain-containing protein, partial [Deltaproteobacteria bacterium]|nr:FAD binding domain-containing protein [Deltaproteobacteria bacterium]
MTIKAFAYPATVKEAVGILGDPDRRAIALGGGTALAHGNRRGAELLVDITRCGLDRIAVDYGNVIHVGATARCTEIAAANALPNAEGALLRETAAGVATQPLRNAITLGGNIFHLASWSDLPVALLALDAQVQIAHVQNGDFAIPMAALVAVHPLRALPANALITGVSLGVGSKLRGSAYRRFRPTATDYALISVAALLEVENKRCLHAAIAVGAVGPRPMRAAGAEKMLSDGPLTPKRIAEAAHQAAGEVAIAPNYRLAADVRRRILEVEVRRAIEIG